MATLRHNQNVEVKHKLSNTLRNWLPILQSSIDELEDIIKPMVDANPLVEIGSGFEKDFKETLPKKVLSGGISSSRTQKIEALTTSKKSLYDVLQEHIQPPLFPTPISQKVAQFVIENLEESGYYDGDTQKFCDENGIDKEQFETIRSRFRFVEPVGIGAKDLIESFLFQLDNSDIKDEAYSLACEVINNLSSIHTYATRKEFAEVKRVLGTFKNPPNIEFEEEPLQVIPDLMIFFDDEHNIEVKLNDESYPIIHIDSTYKIRNEFVSQKIKEAKNIVDALQMRKATLYKVGLMIVEYQYDFFVGGDIMPLTLKTLADEFGHNPSTISRAIANKYIACDRGVFAMKEFFTTAIDEDVSNATIKDFVAELIKNEDRKKPLSDMKILSFIQDKFKVKMVRRTIAKYRKQLNIAGSSDRKKLYSLEV